MPKFYIQSGPVRLIFDAADAEQAAVMAFQWTWPPGWPNVPDP